MQIRSGRRLVSPQPRGGQQRRGRILPRVPEDDGEDRISGLPDEMLLDVLGRLGCAGEAARTSVLSRRWRGDLWTELRKLTFRDVGADALEPVLARVRPELDYLDIRVRDEEGRLTGAQITTLLRAAARLAPEELAVTLQLDTLTDVTFELPCFGRATSFELDISNYNDGEVKFTLPQDGAFASLEQLTVRFMTTAHYLEDLIISRCPRLLRLDVVYDFDFPCNITYTFESKTLEEIDLSLEHIDLMCSVVVVAPELKEFTLVSSKCGDLKVSLSAPKLEDILLDYTCQPQTETHDLVGFGERWQLWNLRMQTAWSDLDNEQLPIRVYVLSLTMVTDKPHITFYRSLAEEIAQLPVNSYSVLELSIRTKGHVFGPLALHLLQIRTSIKRLKLVLTKNMSKECSQNCDCDQDTNWRTERISLPDLQDIEIQGFSAADHELDLLELLFESTPSLKRMAIQLYDEVSPNSGGRQRLQSIFEANAFVKCSVRDIPYVEDSDCLYGYHHW